MFIYPSTALYFIPGDPTVEAIFREQYLNADEPAPEAEESLVDHTARHRASLIRAHLTAGVGRFFV